MKVTRKQASIVALSMAAFVVLAGVLLYFQFREPRHGGKTFTQWVTILNTSWNAPTQQDEAFDALVAMGPRVIPWIHAALDEANTPPATFIGKLYSKLPARIVARLPKVSTQRLTMPIVPAYWVLNSLEPDGTTTIPFLIQLSAKKGPYGPIALDGIWRFHPAIEKIMPTVRRWIHDGGGWVGGTQAITQAYAFLILNDYPDEAIKLLPKLLTFGTASLDWFKVTMVIARCGPAASNALPALEKTMQTSSVYQQCVAAYAIAKISPERTDEMASFLAKEIKAGEPSQSRWNMDFLRALGPKARPALPALLEILKTEPPDLGAYAAATIGVIGPSASSAIDVLQAASEGRAKTRNVSRDSETPSVFATPEEAAIAERVEALIAMTRIDHSRADECGSKLAQILDAANLLDRRHFMGVLSSDSQDTGRGEILFQLLEGKADNLLPYLARSAWYRNLQASQRLAPFLVRLIERQPKDSPLREEAERALKLIAPPGSEKNQ